MTYEIFDSWLVDTFGLTFPLERDRVVKALQRNKHIFSTLVQYSNEIVFIKFSRARVNIT